MALGGYGRKELCPGSDIDILVLYRNNAYKLIERLVRFYWDAGLNPGCVVRTLPECKKILGEDISTDTAYLHARYICGNKHLFDYLSKKIINAYFHKRRKHFIGLFRDDLVNKIQKPVDSIYHVEPDLKNGICTLRDCHRLLWAEMLRSGTSDFSELTILSHFKKQDVEAFELAYDFLLDLRNELHIFSGRRIDILEIAVQPELAVIMGFQNPGEILEEYFLHIRKIKHFISLFLEKNPGGEGIFSWIRRRFSSVKIDYKMYMVDGIIYPVMKHFHQPRITPLPEEILDFFETALIYRAYFSNEFLNIIRSLVERIPPEAFFSDRVFQVFKRILQSDDIGPVLMLMHETHVLEKIIPEFRALVCKVEYDSYHELTVDQHILLSVSYLDYFEDREDEKLNLIYRSLRDKFLLKLGILLHDIGKAMDGNHAQSGAVIAENICIRLGLDERDIEKISFLIMNHLLMSEISFAMEFEPGVIADFARKLETKEKLDMLYILTVIDIKNVGKKAWSEWKGVQLNDLYDRTLSYMENPDTDLNDKPGHPFDVSPFLASDLDFHKMWIKQFRENSPESGIFISIEKFIGFLRITFIAHDRKGLFCDITGCLTSEGFNILSANGYTLDNEFVVDVFHVELDEHLTLTIEEIERRLLGKWKKITNMGITADQLIEERLRLYPRTNGIRQKSGETRIEFDNKTSKNCTLLQISTNDRFQLLYTIAKIISRMDLNIISAKLSSRIGLAKDSFYLTDSANLKIEDEDMQRGLKKQLRDSIG